MQNRTAALILAAAAAFGAPASAQVHKCQAADGKIEYRNTPCASGSTGGTIGTPAAAVSRQLAAADEELRSECLAIQGRIDDSQRVAETHRKVLAEAARAEGPAGAGRAAAHQRELELMVGQEKYVLDEQLRRGRSRGCDKVLALNTPQARAAAQAWRCERGWADYEAELVKARVDRREIELAKQQLKDQGHRSGCK